MSLDDYGQQRGSGPRELRSRVREQDRELAVLRRRVAELEAGTDAVGPEQLAASDVAGQPPADRAVEPVTAELAAEREAREAAEAELMAERARYWEIAGHPGRTDPPGAVPPEAIRAAALDRAASSGAIPATEGLDGMLVRLQDRSVPYPQLLQEMQAMGFKDGPDGWD